MITVVGAPFYVTCATNAEWGHSFSVPSAASALSATSALLITCARSTMLSTPCWDEALPNAPRALPRLLVVLVLYPRYTRPITTVLIEVRLQSINGCDCPCAHHGPLAYGFNHFFPFLSRYPPWLSIHFVYELHALDFLMAVWYKKITNFDVRKLDLFHDFHFTNEPYMLEWHLYISLHLTCCHGEKDWWAPIEYYP